MLNLFTYYSVPGKMVSFLKCAPILAPKALKRHDLLEESTPDISISYDDQGKSYFFTCQAPTQGDRPPNVKPNQAQARRSETQHPKGGRVGATTGKPAQKRVKNGSHNG